MQVAVECIRDPEQRVDPRWPAATLEPRDRGLGGADKLGEPALREPPFDAPLSDGAGNRGEEPSLLGARQASA